MRVEVGIHWFTRVYSMDFIFRGIMSYSTRNGCDYIIKFNNVTCCMVFFQNRKCENYLAQNWLAYRCFSIGFAVCNQTPIYREELPRFSHFVDVNRLIGTCTKWSAFISSFVANRSQIRFSGQKVKVEFGWNCW